MSNASATPRTDSILKAPTPNAEINTRKKGFTTTVEIWKWGGAKRLCPKCGNQGLPLVRKQSKKISKNALGAICLISCWPICFLPFLVGGSDSVYLFCEKCGFFLGTYDRKTGKVNSSCGYDLRGQSQNCVCKSNL